MSALIQTQRGKVRAVKILALLSLVRWYNLLLTAVAQYLAAFFILKPHYSKLDILLDWQLHIVVFSTALLIASGYIINSFYDTEADMINKPREALFMRIINKRLSLSIFLLFNSIGVALATLVGFKILIFQLGFSFMLWFYSHKLKKLALIGNITASILSVTSFLSVCLYFEVFNLHILFYLTYMLLIVFVREAIKNLEAMKGDVIFGYKTLPIELGENKTKKMIYALNSGVVFHPAVLYYFKDFDYLLLYFLLSAVLIIYATVRLLKANNSQDYHHINNVYKIIMLIGIACIPLVY